MRLVLVSENMSMRMGGEASRALYFFRLMRNGGVDVWAVCHARVRDELREALSEDDFARLRFVEDTRGQRAIWRIGRCFPDRIKDLVFGQLIHLGTQRKARRTVRGMIERMGVDLVYEPSPNTPKGLSFMYRLGVPVVIGPLCGGMSFPPAFRHMDSWAIRASVGLGRLASVAAHRIVPGKREADALLVANDCTAQALPRGCRGRVYPVVESGVDLSIWEPKPRDDAGRDRPVRFVFAGRFVYLKGIEFLIEAFQQVADRSDSVLELIGGGPLQKRIEARVSSLNLGERVRFHGWIKRQESARIIRDCDVFVMPSLRECGGTVLLEAMAMGLPVVAVRWGGPANLVDESCGFLVDPASHEELVDGLAASMTRLAESPELRRRMGEAGPRYVRSHFLDWEAKTDRVIEICEETLHEFTSPLTRPDPARE